MLTSCWRVHTGAHAIPTVPNYAEEEDPIVFLSDDSVAGSDDDDDEEDDFDKRSKTTAGSKAVTKVAALWQSPFCTRAPVGLKQRLPTRLRVTVSDLEYSRLLPS